MEKYQPLLDTGDIDFILCLGDGKTDEINFQILKESFGERIATCATVGKKQTAASWYIEEVGEVSKLLEMLLL